MNQALFSDALVEALRSVDRVDAIDRVKQVVINELRESDDQVSIHKTDYFNHSFVPDMVLKWRGERESRYLFLRPDVGPDTLLEDVALSAETKPIFFSLTRIEGARDDRDIVSIQETSHDIDTLVTDSRGIEELIDQRRVHPVVRLASSAVLQGARGLLDRTQAVAVANALTTGMDAASRTELADTEVATSAISSAFDNVRSSRLNGLLQAVWIGSGGQASAFPGRYELSSGLGEDALSYLIQLGHIGDDSFWKRIGRRLSLAALARLRVEHPSENFQKLVISNLDVLQAKSCLVLPTPIFLAPSDEGIDDGRDGFSWQVDRGVLVYRGPRYSAYVAQKKDDLEKLSQVASETSYEQLIQRLNGQNIAVTELTLGARGKTISYSSDRPINILEDDQLSAVVSALGRGVNVRQLVAAIRGRSPVTGDFRTSLLSGRTTATYPVMELIELAMTLMADLTESEASVLEELVTENQEEGPYTLFSIE